MSLHAPRYRQGAAAAGFTLIELMIALLLGLLVVGGAIGIFMSNSRTYKATESLGRIQESARMGFELLARDIREADGTPCRQPQPVPATGADAMMLPVANLLNETDWWASWGTGLRGFESGALAGSLAGTDAIQVHSATRGATTVASFASSEFTLSAAADGFAAGDVVMVCDGNQGTIFHAGTPSGSTVPVGTTGNCGTNLGLGGACGSTSYTYSTAANGQAMMAQVDAVRWYVGPNGRGGNSLWQRRMGALPAEIIDGVLDLELTYLLPGATSYVNATTVGTRWKDVTAVRIALGLEGQQGTEEDRIKVGTDGRGLRRQITHVVTLRNRNI